MICQNPEVTIFSFHRKQGTWNKLNNFLATMGLSLYSRRHRSQDWETSGDWRLPGVQFKVFGERHGQYTRVGIAFDSILITILSVFDQPMRNYICTASNIYNFASEDQSPPLSYPKDFITFLELIVYNFRTLASCAKLTFQ